MPKVEFKRVQTDEEVENIDIKDGQLIYTGTGKTYMDYGSERIPTGSGGEGGSTEVYIQDTEPTEEDWKIWIDTDEVGSAASEITNEYSESIGLGYSANYTNNLHTYSTDEVRVGTWIDGKPLYRKVYIFPTLANTGNVSVNIDNTFKVQKYDIYVENPNNFKFKLPVMGTNYISSFMDYTSNKLTIQTTSDRTAFTDNYAIIEYTKTTD